MPLPNATPPLQRVSNENSAPSVGGLPARERLKRALPRPASPFFGLPSFLRSLARSLALLLHQFGNSWSVVFLPNGPR